MKVFPVCASFFALIMPTLASAGSWIVNAKVTVVEASHMPNAIYFTIDQAAGTCPAGAFLSWIPQGNDEPQTIANAESAFATLITAKTTGQVIRISGDASGCAASLLYLYN